MMSWRHVTRTALIALLATTLSGSALAVSSLAQGARPLSVQSDSMAPTFRKGDLVIVKPVTGQRYTSGDIITFINPKNKKETITHRIVEIPTHDAAHSPKIITKGDANIANDGYIPVHLVLGKVSFSLPYAGYVLDFLRQPVGLLLAIYIPALTIVASEIRRLAAYYKQLEPYVAAGFDPSEHAITEVKRPPASLRFAKAGSIATIVLAGLAVPVAHAALTSNVALTDSSASTIATNPGTNYPLISKVNFGSNGSGNNTTIVNVINNNPQSAVSGNATVSGSNGNATTGSANNSSNTSITFNISNGSGAASSSASLYNPTDTPIDLSNWTLADNEAIHPLPTGIILAPHSHYNFIWPVSTGLTKASDRLLLRNSGGVLVDSISWGSDNSHLNPAITTSSTTSSLTRTNPESDTDMAADWQAS